MYGRVMTMEIRSGGEDEAIAIYRDCVVPAASEQKGFKGALLLVDRSTNRAMAISLWESQADIEAAMATGHLQPQAAKLISTFAAPPVRETYEVAVQV